jgi:hypothetical protein
MSLFRCLGRTKVSVQVRGFVCEYFVTKIRFHSDEMLAPHPTPKLEDHPLSDVRDCLFNIFAGIFCTLGPFLHPQPEDAPCRFDRYRYSHGSYNLDSSIIIIIVNIRSGYRYRIKLIYRNLCNMVLFIPFFSLIKTLKLFCNIDVLPHMYCTFIYHRMIGTCLYIKYRDRNIKRNLYLPLVCDTCASL